MSPSLALQLLDVGRRHFVAEESLSSIAAELGVSRFKVARMVREARDRGLVQITIMAPANVDLPTSDAMKATWPELDQCVVIPPPAPDGPQSVRSALAEAAAQLVMQRVRPDDVFGLACGRTVNETAARIRRLPSCTIVQLTGVTSHDAVADSSIRTMQRVAALSHGRSFPIYAPVVLESAGVVDALSREPGIGAALSRAEHLTTALVTVGAWRDGESTLYAACPAGLRDRVRDEGAVAEFMGYLIDAEGRIVGSEFTQRCLVAPLDAVRAAKNVILVVSGEGRVDAIRSVLAAGIVKQVVIDSSTASLLLSGDPSREVPSP